MAMLVKNLKFPFIQMAIVSVKGATVKPYTFKFCVLKLNDSLQQLFMKIVQNLPFIQFIFCNQKS